MEKDLGPYIEKYWMLVFSVYSNEKYSLECIYKIIFNYYSQWILLKIRGRSVFKKFCRVPLPGANNRNQAGSVFWKLLSETVPSIEEATMVLKKFNEKTWAPICPLFGPF